MKFSKHFHTIHHVLSHRLTIERTGPPPYLVYISLHVYYLFKPKIRVPYLAVISVASFCDVVIMRPRKEITWMLLTQALVARFLLSRL